MEYKQSLARRIVIAFMLMTVAVGGLFHAVSGGERRAGVNRR